MSEKLIHWSEAQSVNWTSVLESDIQLGSHYQVMPTEGYLAWEYNPLRNYRLNTNMYEKDCKYYSKEEIYKTLKITTSDETTYLNNKKSLQQELVKSPQNKPEIDRLTELVDEFENKFNSYTLREAGELVDFITNELSFDLSHPVDIVPQYSYDGSVNLILNDGLNIPRLINSRFTVTGKNTYKIIDRKGDNDTNIYDQGNQFDVDTSLFKNVNKIPKLEYLGTANGNMKIGNYHFYFKYADADGNESDWVAESGLVSVFMGNTPQSVNTGIRDENSVKSVRFKLSNIDIGYSYVHVYYTRYSSDVDSNLVVSAKRIEKNFLINHSGVCSILITGDENETEVTLEEINSSFDIIQNAKTQCTAANRLFMANVHKSKIEYEILSKLSLCFCPYKYEEPYPLVNGGINEEYEISSIEDGYYDTKYIYNKTGYWPGELYRLGVVYILKDGSLSPVFNIRGATDIPTLQRDDNGTKLSYYSVETELNKVTEDNIEEVLQGIDYSEEDFRIIGGQADNENAKGVIQLSSQPNSKGDPFAVIGITITTDKRVISNLKKYVKGFFFVRQKRIPLTMCQGLVVGLDKESRTPTLPTLGGVLSNIDYDKSFIETSDINDINYISEGFLSRYRYSLKAKDTGGWSKFLTAVSVVAVLAAATVATVFTAGAAGVFMGAGLAATISGSVTVGTVLNVTAAIAGASVIVSGVTIGAQTHILKARQRRNDKEAKAVKGRNDEIPKGYKREEQKESRQLLQNIEERYIIKDVTKNSPDAIIVPDYQVNQPYYNQFLTGDTFTVKLSYEQPNTNYLNDGYLESNYRHFYTSGYQLQMDNRSYKVDLVGVPDGCPIKMIGENVYRARAGYPEEVHQYEFQGNAYDDSVNKRDNSDIIRGNFGSYIGMSGYEGHACDQVNIMIPGYKENDLFNYVQLRVQDNSAFYAISDRIDINSINQNNSMLSESYKIEKDFEETYYRGDSYICQYTHRINRNFNDPSAPYNDKVIDENSWKDNYNPDKPQNYSKINLGDVNAIQLGMWLTFWIRSSYNLNIRTIDKSNIDESIMCGNYRSFYPHYGQLATGSQKIPDSNQYNKGFTKSVSEKYYFEVPDVPYIKQEFQNRIVFSDIHINDAYKNGFRVIRNMHHKDFPMTYGSITKLIELKNALLIVFEHGIGLVAINNQAEHPSQILSDLNIISDTYGSQWKDSIIKTPSGVYGVDTVAKKIWRVKEGQIKLISDTRVQEFLNQNITLSERELTPILGIRNVKTLYNAFKHDIMFTFYDNLHGTQEKAWNLCWNEILGIFTTFYSWIPSDMENIDNIPFSFNRDTVKAIGKLGVSDHDNSFSDGITLTNNVLNITKKDNQYSFTLNNYQFEKTYVDKEGNVCQYEFMSDTIPMLGVTTINAICSDPSFIGFLHLDNRVLPEGKVDYEIQYELLRDRFGNHKLFTIKNANVRVKSVNTLFKNNVTTVKVYYLCLANRVDVKELLSEIYYRNKAGNSYADVDTNKWSAEIIKDDSGQVIRFDVKLGYPIFKNKAGKRLTLPLEEQLNPDKIIRYLNIRAKVVINKGTDASKASQEAYYEQFTSGGQIDAGYFESQVVVTTDHNLSLLSTDFWKHGQAGIIDITDKIFPTYWYGKQHTFEFECVVVDDPSIHKIFTNLELISNKVKPESFHYEVVGDVYDFSEDKPTMYFRQEALKALYQYNGYNIEYNPNFLEIEPKQHNRSADLPKYYSRWDTINDVYDSYKRFSAPMGFNYDHLAGAEVVYYPTRNEFRVWNHVEAIDVDSLNQDITTSVIKANCRYLEDKWLVSINPIVVTYKNEIDKTKVEPGTSMFSKDAFGIYKYSTWVNAHKSLPTDPDVKLPPINIQGTKIQEKLSGNIEMPGMPIKLNEDGTYNLSQNGKDNALYGLYDLMQWNKGDWRPIDPTKNKERRETDVRGKFMTVRIRYSGEELAIIDFLNTIYQISFA